MLYFIKYNVSCVSRKDTVYHICSLVYAENSLFFIALTMCAPSSFSSRHS